MSDKYKGYMGRGAKIWEDIEDPIKKLTAKAIIREEIGPKSPYVISFAGTGEDGKGKSGLSFGHLQFDIANNSAAQALLEEILDSHYEKGYYAKHEQNLIKSGTDAQKFLNNNGELIEEINDALSSEFGKKRIDDAFFEKFDAIVSHIKALESKMKEPLTEDVKLPDGTWLPAGLALPADEQLSAGVKLMLADYHNQYGIALDLNEPGGMYGKLLKKIHEGEKITIELVEGLLRATAHYRNNKVSQGQRVDRIVNAAQNLTKDQVPEEAGKSRTANNTAKDSSTPKKPISPATGAQSKPLSETEGRRREYAERKADPVVLPQDKNKIRVGRQSPSTEEIPTDPAGLGFNDVSPQSKTKPKPPKKYTPSGQIRAEQRRAQRAEAAQRRAEQDQGIASGTVAEQDQMPAITTEFVNLIRAEIVQIFEAREEALLEEIKLLKAADTSIEGKIDLLEDAECKCSSLLLDRVQNLERDVKNMPKRIEQIQEHRRRFPLGNIWDYPN